MSDATIEYDGHHLVVSTQENCSVSAFLRREGTFYELGFLELLSSVIPRDTVAIDVGAHIGNHTLYFAAVMGMSVVAAEPNPPSFRLLADNVGRSVPPGRADLVNVALSDHAGTASLGQLSEADAGTASIEAPSPDGGVEVPTTTLDQLWSQHRFAQDGARIGLIKIDVEGHEPAVLAGARHVLQVHRPVVTAEVQSLVAYHELRTLMTELGYAPIAVLNPTPTVIWVAPDGVCGELSRSDPVVEASVAHTIRLSEDLNRVRRRAADRAARARPAAPRPHVLVLGELDLGEPDPGDPEADLDLSVVALSQLGSQVPRTHTAVSADVVRAVRDLGPPALVVVDHRAVSHRVAELVVRSLGQPYVLVYRAELSSHWKSWELINGAIARLLDGPDPQEWQRRLIFSARPVEGALVDEIERLVDALDDAGPVEDVLDDADVRVALVSYFGPPTESVGVNRVEYWYRRMPSLATARGLDVTVDLFTASATFPPLERSRTVIDRGLATPLGEERREVVAELDAARLDTISSTWTPYLVEALEAAKPYDVVVMTGNPFYCFDAAAQIRGLGSRVVLDFRDPFVNNPRLSHNEVQTALLTRFQQEFLPHADAVTTVNGTCLDLVCGEAYQGRRVVISNGFDEKVAVPRSHGPRSSDGATIVLAGRLYATHDPRHLLASLDGSPHRLVHVGPPDPRLADLDRPDVEAIGRVPYTELGEILAEADVGLIITNGDPFEHTTKVFDYIGADLEIVILTDGEPQTGELHDLTANLDGVHWVRNTEEDVADFVASFEPSFAPRADRMAFSRAAQTDRLIDLIVDLL
ncbi:MAG: FkbM family methyltransferase [Ilumatobacter sp.]|uniref:FkbM family methyltransferase n=1 Tax=Ilumatobacter sp. TaxID=1967498 RepID=UPI00261C4C52|nr:FkbM family methyltransferase [Ilumatobacter sp.]MDJ0768355.1 FkbM family methyltransferase [Ilumatobacter sp.]